jgi:hypothetical protein
LHLHITRSDRESAKKYHEKQDIRCDPIKAENIVQIRSQSEKKKEQEPAAATRAIKGFALRA